MNDLLPPATPRPLVLIVDDDAGIRGLLERRLASLGYAVAVANDGATGLELAESLRPTVILTDVHMPVMNGHALLRRLNELGRNSSVVLMSGSGDIDDAIGAIRHGAVDYLKKPWTLEELSTVVERARKLAEALDEVSLPATPAGLAPAQRLRAAGTAVDGAALVEQVTEHAAREHALPPPPVDAAESRLFDAAALRQMFPLHVAALVALNDRIWRFSVARALAMRSLAEEVNAEIGLDPARCHQAGLVLDIGAAYLLSQIDAALGQAGGPIADVPKMRAAIDARHTLVGALILEAWGVDTELVNLTHDHHATSLPVSTPTLWCAAALGAALAVHLTGFGDPLGDNGLASDMLARCAYRLGVGDTTLRHLTRALVPEASRIVSGRST